MKKENAVFICELPPPYGGVTIKKEKRNIKNVSLFSIFYLKEKSVLILLAVSVDLG